MLRTPYEFLPAKLKTNHDFLYGEGGWVNFNKNTQVILNGNKVYHTILTYYEDSHQWKKLEIYHTIDGEKVSYCYVECWYENGRPRYRKNYKNGREDGLMEYWYEVSIAHRSLDMSEDMFKDVDPSLLSRERGQLRYRHSYKNAFRDGLWEEWYANGQPSYRKVYKMGRLVSEEQF